MRKPCDFDQGRAPIAKWRLDEGSGRGRTQIFKSLQGYELPERSHVLLGHQFERKQKPRGDPLTSQNFAGHDHGLLTLTNGILEQRCSQCSIRHGVQPGFQSVDPNKYLETSNVWICSKFMIIIHVKDPTTTASRCEARSSRRFQRTS
jgi:hypothetical protein